MVPGPLTKLDGSVRGDKLVIRRACAVGRDRTMMRAHQHCSAGSPYRHGVDDDRTHGDRMPGDGISRYEDLAGQYGCHTEDARPGQYHSDFSGMHGGMHESNHMMVTVTISP